MTKNRDKSLAELVTQVLTEHQQYQEKPCASGAAGSADGQSVEREQSLSNGYEPQSLSRKHSELMNVR